MAPSLNPTSINDYKLHIYSTLSLYCSNKLDILSLFELNTYDYFRYEFEHIYKARGSSFLHFFQFYIEFISLGGTGIVNITNETLPWNLSGNTVAVKELELKKFAFNNSNNYVWNVYEQFSQLKTFTIQYVIHCVVGVESIFNDFFENQLQIAGLHV